MYFSYVTALHQQTCPSDQGYLPVQWHFFWATPAFSDSPSHAELFATAENGVLDVVEQCRRFSASKMGWGLMSPFCQQRAPFWVDLDKAVCFSPVIVHHIVLGLYMAVSD